MASGVHSNFVLYDKFAQTAFNELLVQMTDAFNDASNGAIVMSSEVAEGMYERNSFYESVAGLTSRRDLTADPITMITQLALTRDEEVAVKLFRKHGPVTNTRGMFRTIAKDPAEFAFKMGEQAAKAALIDQLNSALRAGTAAISGTASNVHNISSASPTDTVSTDHLVQLLSKFGDAANEIVLWVAHSAAFYKLVREQIGSFQFDTVGGVNIQTATPVTLGRPVLVTDSPALWNNASPTDPHKILGLRRGALTVQNSEISDVVVQDVTGGGQLGVTYHAEYAYSLGVRGYRWDIANGGNNPTDTAVGTASNWDQAFTSAKNLAGVMMIADPV